MNVIIRNIITPPGAIQSGEITIESVNVDGDGSRLTYSFDLTPEQISTVSEEEASAVQIYNYAKTVANYCDARLCAECPFYYHYEEDGEKRTRCRLNWPRTPEPMPAPEKPAEA